MFPINGYPPKGKDLLPTDQIEVHPHDTRVTSQQERVTNALSYIRFTC